MPLKTQPSWSTTTILEALCDYYAKYQTWPTSTSIVGSPLPPTYLIKKFFGSLRRAIEAAKIYQEGSRASDGSREDVLAQIQAFYAREGHWPVAGDFGEPQMPSKALTHRLFGSCADAVFQAHVAYVKAQGAPTPALETLSREESPPRFVDDETSAPSGRAPSGRAPSGREMEVERADSAAGEAEASEDAPRAVAPLEADPPPAVQAAPDDAIAEEITQDVATLFRQVWEAPGASPAFAALVRVERSRLLDEVERVAQGIMDAQQLMTKLNAQILALGVYLRCEHLTPVECETLRALAPQPEEAQTMEGGL